MATHPCPMCGTPVPPDSMPFQVDAHSWELGKLVNNSQSFELFLRVFLAGLAGSVKIMREGSHADMPRVDIPRVGDVVPETALTNYDSLGQLIDKYNDAVEVHRRIDRELVEIRDALAHGRVVSLAPHPPGASREIRPPIERDGESYVLGVPGPAMVQHHDRSGG